MKLAFEVDDRLPRLAWLASVQAGSASVTVRHGPWVETFPQGFIEGLWDGPFGYPDFDHSACVFGSGALVRDGTIVFVSSISTTDYLYWRPGSDRKEVAVSNSLPMLLAAIGDELDPHFQRYDRINASIIDGLRRYSKSIPTRGGTVNRLMHANLVVSAAGVSECDKPLPPDFPCFDDYFGYLAGRYRRLAANAKDAGRARPMTIFSTQSRGYDTTAANAIAKDYGIEATFTVTHGKAKGYFADEDRDFETVDDGTDICRVLGLRCVPIDRRATERDPAIEYLFHASMHDNGDLNFQQIGEHVRQPTALITGCLGEIWYPAEYYVTRPEAINADLVRGDLSNHGLTEVRLQAGYVQLALPFIGARSRQSILRITESAEMDPWRLRNDYDRPIPRRIAEQAGVARQMFGQTKIASVLEFPPPSLPLGPALRADFIAHLVSNRLLTRAQCRLLPIVRRWNAIAESTSPKRHLWNYYLQRAISKVIRRPFAIPLIWPRLNGSLFCYCVNRRIADYREAVGKVAIRATAGGKEQAP